MNWFAISVIILQVLASIKYAMDKQFSDSLIWFLYSVINITLVIKAMK